jgi:hypothetical protein
MECPKCLILPALTILKKISNHLDLVKGEPPLPLQSCRLVLVPSRDPIQSNFDKRDSLKREKAYKREDF